jgi:hypothetical protein
MFKLILKDRLGNELNEGDFVKISNGKEFTFYSEIKYIEDKGVIAPFHTFSFHSFEKVDEIPNEAIKSNEFNYDVWFVENPQEDHKAENFKDYLMTWKDCEYHLDKRSWLIRK